MSPNVGFKILEYPNICYCSSHNVMQYLIIYKTASAENKGLVFVMVL